MSRSFETRAITCVRRKLWRPDKPPALLFVNIEAPRRAITQKKIKSSVRAASFIMPLAVFFLQEKRAHAACSSSGNIPNCSMARASMMHDEHLDLDTLSSELITISLH